MTDKPKICGTCAYKSDGFQATPDYCYVLDEHVDQESTCNEWRGSLRDEPVEGPLAKEIP